jgi:hypothetical protein
VRPSIANESAWKIRGVALDDSLFRLAPASGAVDVPHLDELDVEEVRERFLERARG